MMTHPSCKTFLDNLPQDRAENQFQESKPLMSEAEADLESSRCLFCFDAPCITACPTGINIPQFIQRISTGNLRGAARTILTANAMGLSCALACPTEVLCEGACVHKNLTQKSVQIGRLQRFAVESIYKEKIELFSCAPSTGKRVALVGAGPASLSCARDLRLKGHETTIFEKSEIPGGLNTTGIAPYKMKADASLREIERIASLGVQFEFGKELGKNLNITELLENFDAIFIGIGLGNERRLQCPGAELPRVLGAVEWIKKLKTTPLEHIHELKNLNSALIVGGGNTALDAARELKQLNVQTVMVSYRKSQDKMPGYEHEFLAARREGVQFFFNTIPSQIAPMENGNSLRVTLNQIAAQSPEKSLDTPPLKVDLVLLAIGHQPQADLFPTEHPKIFIGGDLSNGGKEVVHAVQSGKISAASIHEVLSHG